MCTRRTQSTRPRSASRRCRAELAHSLGTEGCELVGRNVKAKGFRKNVRIPHCIMTVPLGWDSVFRALGFSFRAYRVGALSVMFPPTSCLEPAMQKLRLASTTAMESDAWVISECASTPCTCVSQSRIHYMEAAGTCCVERSQLWWRPPPANNKCRNGGGCIIVGHVFLQLPVSVSSRNKQGYAWLALACPARGSCKTWTQKWDPTIDAFVSVEE